MIKRIFIVIYYVIAWAFVMLVYLIPAVLYIIPRILILYIKDGEDHMDDIGVIFDNKFVNTIMLEND